MDYFKNFYEESYEKSHNDLIRDGTKDLKEVKTVRDRDYVAINFLKGCDSVFELGCGVGYVLNMTDASRKSGVDISNYAVEIARKNVKAQGKVDLRVVNIDNEELPFDDKSHDGCMAIEVLEHLFDPVHALAELNRILKKDGKIVVTVPNIGYFLFRFYHMFYGEVSDFHGNGMIVNEHIRYYSVKSLKNLLKLTGFGNIRVKGTMKFVISSGTSKQREISSRISFKELLKALRPTPLNILSKLNRVFRLWKKFPNFFAVGIVIEANKIEESSYKYNMALAADDSKIEHREKVNVDFVSGYFK